MIQDPELERIWRTGLQGEDLNESDLGRLNAMLVATLRRFENAYYQNRIGTIEPSQWGSMAVRMKGFTTSPATRDW